MVRGKIGYRIWQWLTLAGTPLTESKVLAAVPCPNERTMLTAISNIIKVTLQ